MKRLRSKMPGRDADGGDDEDDFSQRGDNDDEEYDGDEADDEGASI